jgi:hypothetical protein
MSDDPKNLLDSLSHSGWVIALLTGTWGVVLRFVIGRYAEAADRLENRLRSIETRITVIESRSHNHRRDDK